MTDISKHDRFIEALNVLCHDLRSPLAAILNNLEFAAQQIDREHADPDLLESLDDAVTSCMMLKRLVANLDVLIQSSTEPGIAEAGTISTVIEEVSKNCQSQAALAEVSINIREPNAPFKIVFCRRMVALAFENLLANAIQYAPRNSAVRIRIEHDAQDTLVHVDDEGGAIPAQQRDAALSIEAHTQAGRHPSLRYGRGLGLLAARIAAAMARAEIIIDGEGANSRLSLRIPNRLKQDLET